MQASKYNIFSQIKDSEEYYLVNLLSGSADILSEEEAEKWKMAQTSIVPISEEWIEKGYWVDEKEEKKQYNKKYLDFIDSRETDEIQLFFVPNYACNFACSYCYQDEYSNVTAELNTEITDAFFTYIQTKFSGRKKYITVFGGEPLLNTPKQRSIIEQIILKSKEFGLDLCFVSNGYTIVEYIELLKQASIREMQITLDGTELVHNQRRFLKGGGGTFAKIAAGIDACLANGITVNLRMVIDKENIDDLPLLAQYAIDKGWTKSSFFKTQIGRNYELHHCQSTPDKLFTRISLYEKLYLMVKQHPHVLEFYKPAFSISKFLWENGELPDPLFDSCPACKTEWAFDYTGNIYSCTATVGKADERLGTFYPEVSLDAEAVCEWDSRDVRAISECRDCNLQMACGGGCGSVAKNKNGKVASPDCRPIKELLELGFNAYFQNT